MNQYEQRQAIKARSGLYRDAAKRTYPAASVRDYSAVVESVDADGAFVEIVVWIPRSSIEVCPRCSGEGCSAESIAAHGPCGNKVDGRI